MHRNKRKYATIYCSLHKKAAKKLKGLANKQRKTESEVLRRILDAYLKKMENKNLPYSPPQESIPHWTKALIPNHNKRAG